MDTQKQTILDEADIAVFNINRNREQRRRFYKANRKAYKGLTFSEVNSDPRVNKITPYVNEEKRADRRAYIKARKGVN